MLPEMLQYPNMKLFYYKPAESCPAKFVSINDLKNLKLWTYK